MPAKITLEALEVLDTIDKKGSFAAAAAALYRVPSAVTYNVRKLEEDLGVVLFQKEGRKAVLTPAGKSLLKEGREILEAVGRLVETTRQIHKGWESNLRIVVDTVLDTIDLFPFIESLYTLNPELEINLYSEVLGGTIEAIIEDRADIALGVAPFPTYAAGIQVEQIAILDWVFAVAKDHPLTHIEGEITLEQIREYRTVLVRDTSRHLPPISHRVFNKQNVLRVSTMKQKIEAQIQGLGVGFLPAVRVAPQVSSGELVPLDVHTKMEHVPLNIAWKKDNKGKALKSLIQEIRKNPGKLFFTE